ncbi:hypothetical protein [Synechococcus sp. M16CYN]|uniref:hypothetical protein n=1 Tax=Synechococcus sp. M16CYN TaxID=3103139 RepID=UPI00333E8DDD
MHRVVGACFCVWSNPHARITDLPLTELVTFGIVATKDKESLLANQHTMKPVEQTRR